MSEWSSAQLGDLVTFQKGKKVETSPYLLPGYHRYLGASSLSGNDGEYASTYLAVQANTDDVLMLWDGERSGLVGHGLEGVVSSTVSKLTPNGKIASNYLYYFLLNSFEWIQNRRTGTGIPHVSKDLGRILSIDFPIEKCFQKKIALVLETIDQNIGKTKALIEKYQQIKTGLIQDLFTRGIGSDGKLRPPRDQAPELYHVTNIGWIPKDWHVAILQDIVNPTRPICYGILMPGYGFEGGIPVVKVKNIKHRKIDADNLLLTSPSIDNEYKRSKLKPNDILLTIRGTVGRICLVPPELDEANITQDTARIDISKGINEFYSWYFETASAKRHFSVNTLGVAVQGINIGEVRKTPVPIVAMDEQAEIANRLSCITNKIETEKSLLAKLKHLKIGTMNDLLTGRKAISAVDTEVTCV